MSPIKSSNILTTEPSNGYELLDSGEGFKLERFGEFVLSRPDPQALWHQRLPASEWKNAAADFTNTWNYRKTLPEKWQIELGGLKFWIRPSSFKHVGLFPEQSVNWSWLGEKTKKDSEVLNLFGYTGGASLAAAKAGAKVVHVDGSKVALTWARENAELSGLGDCPIRWILEDAPAFVRREIKRERRYQGVVMDPPAFGHGPKNELWKIEEHLPVLIDDCFKLLSDQPDFFLINGYAAGYSALAYENLLQPLVGRFGGQIEIGELSLSESSGLDKSGSENSPRLLPCGIFARWSR